MYSIPELSEMIYKNMVPTGQVYTYDGIGENDNYASLPSVINTDENNPLLRKLMRVWLGENSFVLIAQSSFPQLHRVSNNALVYENDLDASIRWIALMTTFQPKIDITLQYVSTPGVSSTRSLWADFPAFLRLIKLAFRYDMLLTVNGRRAEHQAPVAANYRGVDIRFVNNTNEQDLLLHLIRLSNRGKIGHWTIARLGSALAACLDYHHWSTTNLRIWKAVKRIRLPCDTVAFLGPHNLLFKTPDAALAAVRAVNMGEKPNVACLDNEWRESLAAALENWRQALKTQLMRYTIRLFDSDWSRSDEKQNKWSTHAPRLGIDSAFGLYGDENLWQDVLRRHRRPPHFSIRERSFPNRRIYDFATNWELAEQASGELYRTEIHLASLTLATNVPLPYLAPPMTSSSAASVWRAST